MKNSKSRILRCFVLSTILLEVNTECKTLTATTQIQAGLGILSDHWDSEITASKNIKSSASKNSTEIAAKITTTKLNDDITLTSTKNDESLNFTFDEKKFLEAAQNQTHEFLFEDKRREDALLYFDAKHHPFAVVLVSDVYSICSGTLVAAEWVLTAAHCLAKVRSVWVYGGLLQSAFRVNHQHLPPGVDVIASREWYIHPNFNWPTYNYDVALIRLHPPFRLSEYIYPLRLTESPWPSGQPRTCVFTGFGKVHWEGWTQTDFMRKTQQLQVGRPCPCERYLRQRFGEAVDRHLCKTKSFDYGTCAGDSGSGLVCNFRVCGVTSYLVDVGDCQKRVRRDVVCGHANTLSGFQDLYPSLPWIRRYVQPWAQSRRRGIAGEEDPKNIIDGTNNADSRHLRTFPLSLFASSFVFIVFNYFSMSKINVE